MFKLTKQQKEKLKKMYSKTKHELGEVMGEVDKYGGKVNRVTSRMAANIQGGMIPQQTRPTKVQFQKRRRFSGLGFEM